MRRCIELAENGAGHVSPNPMVGAVVVYNGEIIGEGFHQKYGEAHAEVNAIASVKDKKKLKDAVLYVSLEPCCHFGKTPPCTNLIIESGIRHVVIGMPDPFEQVSGKGIEQLRASGIAVDLGVLEDDCRWLNRRFVTHIVHKRPYVILKWAESADQFLSPDARQLPPEVFNERRHITGFIVQKLVHRWRSMEDAILVGTQTILSDNPALNVRAWEGRNPVRIALDKSLRIPESSKIKDGSQPTVIFNTIENQIKGNIQYIRIDFEKDIWPQILHHLYQLNIQSLIVEGGAQTLQTLLEGSYWDEMQVFTTSGVLESGVQAPAVKGKLITQTTIDDSLLRVYVQDKDRQHGISR